MARGTGTGFFIGVLVRNIFSLVLIIAVCLILSAAYLRGATYKYEVTMEVASFSIHESTNQETAFSGSSFLGLQNDETSIAKPFGLYLRHLTSHTTAAKLYQNEDVLRRLFPERWNAKQGEWVVPASPFSAIRTRIRKFVNYPQVIEAKPNVEALRSMLERKLQIEDADNSLRKISIYVEDPKFGVELLDALHKIADENSREFVRRSSIERLKLLEKRYDEAPVSEVQINLGSLLTHYKRILIMTDGGENFAAEQFQSPVHNSNPSMPNPKIVFALAAAVGMIVFILLMLIRANSANRNEQVPLTKAENLTT